MNQCKSFAKKTNLLKTDWKHQSQFMHLCLVVTGIEKPKTFIKNQALYLVFSWGSKKEVSAHHPVIHATFKKEKNVPQIKHQRVKFNLSCINCHMIPCITKQSIFGLFILSSFSIRWGENDKQTRAANNVEAPGYALDTVETSGNKHDIKSVTVAWCACFRWNPKPIGRWGAPNITRPISWCDASGGRGGQQIWSRSLRGAVVCIVCCVRRLTRNGMWGVVYPQITHHHRLVHLHSM